MAETRGQSREEAGRKGGEAAMAAETGSAASITHVLSGIKFPCKKEDIVQHAKNQDADDAIMNKLQNLPRMEFHTMADVMKGIGEESEHRGRGGESSRGSRDEGGRGGREEGGRGGREEGGRGGRERDKEDHQRSSGF